MTRSELASRLAASAPDMTAGDCDTAVRLIIDALALSLAKGGRAEIRGFGSFCLKARRPRLGRNPRTGIAVPVPAKFVPHFKPGNELRARVDLKTSK